MHLKIPILFLTAILGVSVVSGFVLGVSFLKEKWEPRIEYLDDYLPVDPDKTEFRFGGGGHPNERCEYNYLVYTSWSAYSFRVVVENFSEELLVLAGEKRVEATPYVLQKGNLPDERCIWLSFTVIMPNQTGTYELDLRIKLFGLLFSREYKWMYQFKVEPFIPKTENSITKEGVSLQIRTDKAEFEIGETIRVKALLCNELSKPVEYEVPNPCSPDVHVFVRTKYGDQALWEDDYEPLACPEVIDQRTLQLGERIEREVVWDQFIHLYNEGVQAPSGDYEICALFYAGRLTEDYNGDLEVKVSVFVKLRGEAKDFLTSEEAIQIALNDPEVSLWYESHRGKNLVQLIDGHYYVIIDGELQGVTEEFAHEVLKSEPKISVMLENKYWLVTFTQKLGDIPHKLKIRIDICSSEIFTPEKPLSITLDKERYHQGEKMNITIKNISNETVWFTDTAYNSCFERSNGVDWKFHTPIVGCLVMTPLEPGETAQLTWTLDVPLQPFPPGRYRVGTHGVYAEFEVIWAKPSEAEMKDIVIEFLKTTDVAESLWEDTVEILEIYDHKFGGKVLAVNYTTVNAVHPHFMCEAIEHHTAVITLNERGQVVSAFCVWGGFHGPDKIWDLVNQRWVEGK